MVLRRTQSVQIDKLVLGCEKFVHGCEGLVLGCEGLVHVGKPRHRGHLPLGALELG